MHDVVFATYVHCMMQYVQSRSPCARMCLVPPVLLAVLSTWPHVKACAPHAAAAMHPLVMPPKQQLTISDDVEPKTLDELISSPEVYNVELAWLAFNWRVLSNALLPRVPLLERLQFLAITNSNLDGFFQKRVGGLMKQQAAGVANMKKSLSQTPAQQLAAISAEVKRMFRWHTWALQQLVLPELEQQGICLLTPAALSKAGTAYLRTYYVEQVDKLLTPIKCAVLSLCTWFTVPSKLTPHHLSQ